MPTNLNGGSQEETAEQTQSTEQTAQQEQQNAENAESAQDQSGQANDEQAGNESTEQSGGSDDESSELWEGIPDDHPVRKELSKVRDESAARRIEVQRLQEANSELQDKLKDAKTSEEFEQAIAEYDSKVEQANLETIRERVGRTHNLPDALVARLQGSTEEELTNDAKALAALVGEPQLPPPPGVAPSGGLVPKRETEDSASIAASIRQRRY